MNPDLTRTENGALQLRSSGNKCLDLFAEIGSARELVKNNAKAIEDLFLDAYAESPETVTYILYWVRAIREGAGERSVFHHLHKLLWNLSPNVVKNNLAVIGELGYWKDYLQIMKDIPELTEAITLLFAEAVGSGNHYACKWIPRNSKLWVDVRAALHMTNKEFRKHVKGHSATVEQQLCAGQLKEIDYCKVPSLALNRYKKMFTRKDKERFFASITTGQVNSSVLFPSDIFPYIPGGWRDNYTNDERTLIDAQWKALPDFINDAAGVLTVCDTSGSMWRATNKTSPHHIAYSLSIYCAERTSGPFKDQVIVFSGDPYWADLSAGKTGSKKMELLSQHCVNACNTNVAKVFLMILQAAQEANLKPEDMPKIVLILSDMQFDSGCNYETTLMDGLKAQYKYAGYDFPNLVYWNLNATNTGIADNEKCALISGYSPRIMKAVLAGAKESIAKNLDPLEVMNTALEPIKEKINVDGITAIPAILNKKVDFNPTRGASARHTNNASANSLRSAFQSIM